MKRAASITAALAALLALALWLGRSPRTARDAAPPPTPVPAPESVTAAPAPLAASTPTPQAPERIAVEPAPAPASPPTAPSPLVRPRATRASPTQTSAGVTVAGHVRDETGASLAGVSVVALGRGSALGGSTAFERTSSAADGSFRLAGLRPGVLELTTHRDGYEPLARTLGRLDEGTELTDVELVLASGASISGRVVWPGGAPADVAVSAMPQRPDLVANWSSVEARTDAAGAFVLRGLAAGEYRVGAHDEDGPGEPATSPWSAEAEHVGTGTRDLVLVLSPGIALAGRVVDERGLAVAGFDVRASRLVTGFSLPVGPPLSGSFEAADGGFRLEGFTPGAWELRAEGPDHAPSAPVRVTVPPAEPVVLVLARGAAVSGEVVDSAGRPVPHALVRVGALVNGEGGVEHRADAAGTFRIEGLAPGVAQIAASAREHAPSEPRMLELAPGAAVHGLVLALRASGRIEGELLDADGRPRAGEVAVTAAGRSDRVKAGKSGRFEVEALAPGTVTLRAETPAGMLILERVTVAAGETARVRLAPPRDVVRLRGHVEVGGEPLARGQLSVTTEAGDARERPWSSTALDGEGAYELELAGPGEYVLRVHGLLDGPFSWSARLEVPPVAVLEHDVRVPLARVSGRVTDARGAALAGVLAEAHPERHEGGAHGGARTYSGDDGSYLLRVPPGRYAVEAGKDHSGPAPVQPYEPARVEGLVVAADEDVRGIDLVLAPGAVLEGVVRNADGSAAPRAELLGLAGGTVETLGRCDLDGGFRLGLAAGPQRIGATGLAPPGVVAEPLVLELAPGETRRIELVLSAATYVRLAIRAGGAPAGCELSLADEHGAAHPARTGANGEGWLGPLLPGRYTVRGRRDGRTAERTFEVAGGQRELALELVFE